MRRCIAAAALATLPMPSVALPRPESESLREGSAEVGRRSADGGEWRRVAGFSATVATGVSFASATEGIVIGGQNGAGAAVWTTHDGGGEFRPAVFESDEPPFFLIDGAIVRDSAVTSGMLSWAWDSQDGGRSFRPSDTPQPINIGPQMVEGFIQDGQPTFVIIGESMFYDGISVSRDGGSSFSAGIDVFADRTVSPINPRYGAFPSASAWYVSGGWWPPSDGGALGDEDYLHLSEHIHLSREGGVVMSQDFFAGKKRKKIDSYTAGIAKSVDGGLTWQTVFEQEGDYYFNQISCFSDDHCLAAASGNGVSRVLVTHDGGRSWRQTMDGFSGTLSAMQVMDDGSGEAWAAGGAPAGLELVAHFWHSRDYGETWELHTLPGGIAFDMSFPPGVSDAGFATVLGLVDSGLVQYRRGE